MTRKILHREVVDAAGSIRELEHLGKARSTNFRGIRAKSTVRTCEEWWMQRARFKGWQENLSRDSRDLRATYEGLTDLERGFFLCGPEGVRDLLPGAPSGTHRRGDKKE
jgi:hypothetical protein